MKTAREILESVARAAAFEDAAKIADEWARDGSTDDCKMTGRSIAGRIRSAGLVIPSSGIEAAGRVPQGSVAEDAKESLRAPTKQKGPTP